MSKLTILLILLLPFNLLFAQSLEDLLDETVQHSTQPVMATFKSAQLINSHTTKAVAKDELVFLISHRFGSVNSGFSDLFGLDNATVRFGFEYGLADKLSLGFGRSTYKRNYDFFAKYMILQQTNDKNSIPFTFSVLLVSNVSSAKWPNDERAYLFAHRMSYASQLLIARKFNRNLSLQLMPTFLHKNLVETSNEQNDLFALGIGGRMKVSNRVALTCEYHHMLSNYDKNTKTNPLSLGVDIETGGHVFQLFFTNTSAIYETGYITETTNRWSDGDIRFGFNISRTF